MASAVGDEERDEWFHAGEGQWGLRPGSADTVTNTLTMASKPGQSNRGRWGGTRPLWLFCRRRLGTQRFLFLSWSWCPARRSAESGSRPASRSFRAPRFYGCESGSAQWKRGGQENTCSKVRGRSKWRWKPPLFARQDLQATASYFSLLVLSLMPHNWEAANVDKNQFNDYMTSHLF